MKYRKLPIPIKIEEVTEDRTIETLEGSQKITKGQYLATGVKGEQYAFGKEVFVQYVPVDGQEDYYVKKPAPVVAIQMAYPIEIFRPDWQHKGKAGDYLIIASDTDQYICDQEVFLQTYEKVDE